MASTNIHHIIIAVSEPMNIAVRGGEKACSHMRYIPPVQTHTLGIMAAGASGGDLRPAQILRGRLTDHNSLMVAQAQMANVIVEVDRNFAQWQGFINGSRGKKKD
jgi:hypothetical protein